MSLSLIEGIGVNDVDLPVDIDGARCPFYSAWKSMISRCYSADSLAKHPSYLDCFVCDEWLLFSNFKQWMMSQDWKGKELDKDILNAGNRIYSPENCIFVSKHVNRLLNDHRRGRGDLPLGVTKHKNKFRARCKVENRIASLGCFLVLQDAVNAYNKFKSEEIRRVAFQQVDCRIRNALMIHAELRANQC
jgi:hypothetical protein